MSLIDKNGLKISSELFDFINNEIIPGTTIKVDEFWHGFAEAVHILAVTNESLIDFYSKPSSSPKKPDLDSS